VEIGNLKVSRVAVDEGIETEAFAARRCQDRLGPTLDVLLVVPDLHSRERVGPARLPFGPIGDVAREGDHRSIADQWLRALHFSASGLCHRVSSSRTQRWRGRRVVRRSR
jgi:hypothetical protein